MTHPDSLGPVSDVPVGWSVSNLGVLLDAVNGHAFKKSEWSAKGLPIIRIQNLKDSSAEFNYHAGEIDRRFAVEKGDLLFAWSGTPGTSFGAFIWNGPEGLLNQHIFRLELFSEEIDREYLFYALNYKVAEFISNAQGGVGLAHITKSKFLASRLSIPPFNEQKRIVEKLEQLLSELDKAVESLKAAQEKLKTYRRAVLKAVVEGELSREWREANKDRIEQTWNKSRVALQGVEELPGLPEGWSYIHLGAVIEEPKYGTSKKCRADADGVAVLRIPNVASGNIDTSNLKFAEFDEKEIASYKLEAGDLLTIRSNGSISIVGTCAVVTLQEEKYLYAGYLIRLRPIIHRIRSIYLQSVLTSPLLRVQIESKAKSTSGVNNINSGELQSLIIPICSTEEQSYIEDAVATIFSNADILAKEIEKQRIKLTHLRQSILQKAFSGQLVPQDPNDEPASKLLQRIQDRQVRKKREDIDSRRKKVNAPRQQKAQIRKDVNAMKLLHEVLKENGGKMSADALFKASNYDHSTIDVFYRELRKYILEGHIRESRIEGVAYDSELELTPQ